MDLQKQLTVVLTTHILPTAPSTHIIESCISSIKKQFKNINKCKFLIFCDVKNIEEWVSKEYISNLNQIHNVNIIIEPNSGLKQNYIKAIKSIDTPFMLLIEHDWVFLNKINTPLLMDTMIKDSDINWVRFNKRDNNKSHINNPEPGDEIFWETHIEADNSRDQPLVKTNCIATHPHIVRVHNFKNNWLKYLYTSSIESDLYHAYKLDIDKYGFEEAHKNWGIYNYGDITDKKIIDHLDGSNHYTNILN